MRPSPLALMAGLLLVALLMPAPPAEAARRADDTVTIRFVADGPSPRHASMVAMFRKEISALLEGDRKIAFQPLVQAEWSAVSIKAVVDAALADPEVDLIVAMGILVGNDAGRRETLAKPVIAPVVVDPLLQGFAVSAQGRSTRRNFSFLRWSWSPARDLKTLKGLVDYKHLVVMANAHFVEAVPGLTAAMTMLMATQAARLTVVSVGQDASEALELVPDDADAVYIAPMLHLTTEEFADLAAGLIARRLPSFSLLGLEETEQGIMASTAPGSDYPRLARKVAINVQRILDGEPAGVLDALFEQGEQLTINMATARAIKYYPSWGVLTEAVLLNSDHRAPDRRLDLISAVREALRANKDLAVSAQELEVGRAEVRKSLAPLLPQLDATLSGRLIDSDRARASNGSNPQFAMQVGASLTAVIYSERAWTNRHVQEILQDRRLAEQREVELGVIEETSQAYLDVLRARTLQRIRKQDLARTRANLELARRRKALGASGAADIYRWEAELANDRKDVIAANSRIDMARMALNRLMGRPMEERFESADTTLTDDAFVTSDPRVFKMLDNPWSFGVFRDFMVAEALRDSPELAQIDLALAAQDRVITAAGRAFWVPEVAVQASLGYAFVTAGAGADPTPINIPGVGALPLPTADKFNFSLGLQVSLPLFEGLERFAELDRSRGDHLRLELLRETVAEKIEQRVRTSVFQSGASHPAIRLSVAAAEAAGKNLELVTDAYSRGAVSIPTLLDAQNAARVSDEVAANSVYDFLRDLMSVHRSVGRFFFLQGEPWRRQWTQRLGEHLEHARQAEDAR